jgi:hypothetical protein
MKSTAKKVETLIEAITEKIQSFVTAACLKRPRGVLPGTRMRRQIGRRIVVEADFELVDRRCFVRHNPTILNFELGSIGV